MTHLYRIILHPIESRLTMFKWEVVETNAKSYIIESRTLPDHNQSIRVRIPRDQTNSPTPRLNVYHFSPRDAYQQYAQEQVELIMKGRRLIQQGEKALANLQNDIWMEDGDANKEN